MEMLNPTLTSGEIVIGQPRLVVDARRALDVESAAGAFRLKGARSSVSVARSGKRVTIKPDTPLPVGKHVLEIDQLTTRRGAKIGGSHSIHFMLVESKARVPPRLRIESMVRARVETGGLQKLSLVEPARGNYIEVMKVTDRRSGRPSTLAFDQRGRKVDLERILRRITVASLRQFGKIHPDLHAQFARRRRGTTPVAVWLAVPAETAVSRKDSRRATLRAPRAIQSHLRTLADARKSFASTLKRTMQVDRTREDRLAPVVRAELTKAQVDRLARRKDVAAIFYRDTSGIEDLEDSIAIAQTDDVHAGGKKGSGVRVAVWESGPDDTSKLSIASFFDPLQSSTSEHATHTHGIVKNTESNKPKGHAPSCTLHSANDSDLDALTWAVKTKRCTVVSQSFHRSSEPGSSVLSYDDIYKDWLATNWPYPTILQAAGNFWNGDSDNINPPSDEYVNHKGYNSLAVGNHNDDASGMSGSSVFRNPSSSHSDRELPEISANGTSVTAVGLTKSGTSMAAPALAGITACLQSTSATLKSWPEGCRAILMAGARKNVTNSTWWDDVQGNVEAGDGSGAGNAYESYLITKSRKGRNNTAVQRGWDVGTLRSSDFDATTKLSTFRYRVAVPPGFLSPRHVKVALAWNSSVGVLNLPFVGSIPLTSTLTLDLDLKIFDSNGTQVGYSGSWDNSYEIAEFDGIPGQVYDIRTRRWSGTDESWYGVAWTVTGGLILSRAVRVLGR